MHGSLCIRTLIESIRGIKIEIIQQEQDKGKVVSKKKKDNMTETVFFRSFYKKAFKLAIFYNKF